MKHWPMTVTPLSVLIITALTKLQKSLRQLKLLMVKVHYPASFFIHILIT